MDIKQIFAASWRKIIGILLIMGGIVGLFLPFLQGVAMILGGLVLLGNKPAEQWLVRMREQFKAWRKS